MRDQINIQIIVHYKYLRFYFLFISPDLFQFKFSTQFGLKKKFNKQTKQMI